MEIEITMQEPVQQPEQELISNEPKSNNKVMPDIAVAEDSGETPSAIEKPKKVLSQEDINTISDNVLSDLVDYLAENTEFYHMQDEIIITRMRVIMKEKYNSYIMETISEFIKFLEEDENIQEYIAENGKITYNVRQTEEIHEIISDSFR